MSTLTPGVGVATFSFFDASSVDYTNPTYAPPAIKVNDLVSFKDNETDVYTYLKRLADSSKLIETEGFATGAAHDPAKTGAPFIEINPDEEGSGSPVDNQEFIGMLTAISPTWADKTTTVVW